MKKEAANGKEWTWQVASMVDQLSAERALTLDARVEGPYITSLPDLHTTDRVLAIVGGTGITGALSLVKWWIARQTIMPSPQARLKLVWSIRDATMAKVDEVQTLQKLLTTSGSAAELQIHVSSKAGQLQPEQIVSGFMKQQDKVGGSTFVYISGPDGFPAAAEQACMHQRKLLRARQDALRSKSINWYTATFTV